MIIKIDAVKMATQLTDSDMEDEKVEHPERTIWDNWFAVRYDYYFEMLTNNHIEDGEQHY